MCKYINISKDLVWTILIILPKVSVYSRGINLLEVLWKVVEAIIDTRIKIVGKFHGVLHGFHASRSTGMAIMELKMEQDLASIYQYPLFLEFLDLRKGYDTLHRVRILQTLERYGAGPKMRGLLA